MVQGSANECLTLRPVKPQVGSGGVRKREQKSSIPFENVANEIGKLTPAEEVIDRHTTNRDDQLRSYNVKLAGEKWHTQFALRRSGDAVPTAVSLPWVTLGDRGDVLRRPEVIFLPAGLSQPLEQTLSCRAAKWKPRLSFPHARCLTNDHHSGTRPSGEDRPWRNRITRLQAPAAAAHLLMQLGKTSFIHYRSGAYILDKSQLRQR